MKMLTWNVRGARKLSFAPSFCRISILHKSNICVLLETRLGRFALQRIRRCLPRGWDLYAIESKRLSRVIVVAWDKGASRIDVFHKCS